MKQIEPWPARPDEANQARAYTPAKNGKPLRLRDRSIILQQCERNKAINHLNEWVYR